MYYFEQPIAIDILMSRLCENMRIQTSIGDKSGIIRFPRYNKISHEKTSLGFGSELSEAGRILFPLQ